MVSLKIRKKELPVIFVQFLGKLLKKNPREISKTIPSEISKDIPGDSIEGTAGAISKEDSWRNCC